MLVEERLLEQTDDLIDVMNDGEYKFIMDSLGNWYRYQTDFRPVLQKVHPRLSRSVRMVRRMALKEIQCLVSEVAKRRTRPR